MTTKIIFNTLYRKNKLETITLNIESDTITFYCDGLHTNLREYEFFINSINDECPYHLKLSIMSCKISIKNDGNKSFLIIDECERSIGFTTQINLGKNKYIDTCIKKFEEFEDF